jgi:hypothetical protein
MPRTPRKPEDSKDYGSDSIEAQARFLFEQKRKEKEDEWIKEIAVHNKRQSAFEQKHSQVSLPASAPQRPIPQGRPTQIYFRSIAVNENNSKNSNALDANTNRANKETEYLAKRAKKIPPSKSIHGLGSEARQPNPNPRSLFQSHPKPIGSPKAARTEKSPVIRIGSGKIVHPSPRKK